MKSIVLTKCDAQTISNQIKLDEDIMDLLDEMKLALRLAPDTETRDAATLKRQCEQSEKRKETFNDMMNLITNCGYFIQSYAKDVSFCMYPSRFHLAILY